MKQLAFTICSNNYLAQAVTLGYSLIRHNPDYIFKIGLTDIRNGQINYQSWPFEIVEVSSIGISDFEGMIKRYNIIELNTAVKPFYFRYFFETDSSIGVIVYFDPDILIFGSLNELNDIMIRSAVVITPHFTTPLNDNKWQAEEDFLNSGLYNLGFLALKRDVISGKLIEWWAERLMNKAYINPSKGLFTDQIWINFVPLFFDNVCILKHPGYNMAYWNLHERRLGEDLNVIKDDKSYPLVFFHFSGYDPLRPDILSKYQDRYNFEERSDIKDIFKDYTEKVIKNGYNTFSGYPSYYSELKKVSDIEVYTASRKSIPYFRRIIRSILYRLTKLVG